VFHVEDEVVGQLGRRRVVEERADESLGLAPSDHAAAAGRHRHRTCPPQQLQLYRCALDARDAERHATVVNLVVAVNERTRSTFVYSQVADKTSHWAHSMGP